MGPETCVVSALTLSSRHAYNFSICLFIFPPLFYFVPFSPDDMPRSWPARGSAHTGRGSLLIMVDTSGCAQSFSSSPLTSLAGRAGLELRREPQTQHSILRFQLWVQRPASHACMPSQGPPPLGPGEHHTPGCDGFPRHLQRAPHLFARRTLNPTLVINVVYFD